MSSFHEAIEEFPICQWAQETLSNVRVGSTEITADCPFCYGYQKLYLNIEKKVTNCFRCEAHGVRKGGASLFGFIAELFGSKKAAYSTIKSRVGLPDFHPEPSARLPKASLIPEGVISLKQLPDTEPAIQYLKKRHAAQLVPYSYLCLTGQFRGRVILPCLYDGVLVGSECKSLYKSVKPKSLYHPKDIFKTSQTVYTNLNWNPKSKVAVITESILDAETFDGIENSLGIYGCVLKPEQVDAILALGVEKLIWALDGDAFKKIITSIPKLTLDVFENWVTNLGKKEDPNSIGPQGCKELVAGAVRINGEWDLYDCACKWDKWF